MRNKINYLKTFKRMLLTGALGLTIAASSHTVAKAGHQPTVVNEPYKIVELDNGEYLKLYYGENYKGEEIITRIDYYSTKVATPEKKNGLTKEDKEEIAAILIFFSPFMIGGLAFLGYEIWDYHTSKPKRTSYSGCCGCGLSTINNESKVKTK